MVSKCQLVLTSVITDWLQDLWYAKSYVVEGLIDLGNHNVAELYLHRTSKYDAHRIIVFPQNQSAHHSAAPETDIFLWDTDWQNDCQ